MHKQVKMIKKLLLYIPFLWTINSCSQSAIDNPKTIQVDNSNIEFEMVDNPETVLGILLGNPFIEDSLYQNKEVSTNSENLIYYPLCRSSLKYYGLNDSINMDGNFILAFPEIHKKNNNEGDDVVAAVSISLANDRLNQKFESFYNKSATESNHARRLHTSDLDTVIEYFTNIYGAPLSTTTEHLNGIPDKWIKWKVGSMQIRLNAFLDKEASISMDNYTGQQGIGVWVVDVYFNYSKEYFSKFFE